MHVRGAGTLKNLLAVLLFLLVATPAPAQNRTSMMSISVCNETKFILKMLTDKYKEVVIGGGINKQNEQVRLFVAPNTWTILVTRTDGSSCLVQVSGEQGEWIVAPPEIKGAPT